LCDFGLHLGESFGPEQRRIDRRRDHRVRGQLEAERAEQRGRAVVSGVPEHPFTGNSGSPQP
jgi:hypothetical protein